MATMRPNGRRGEHKAWDIGYDCCRACGATGQQVDDNLVKGCYPAPQAEKLDDASASETVAAIAGTVTVLPQIRPQAGKTYSWVDPSLREIPPGWIPATPDDVDDGEVAAGTMRLCWRPTTEVIDKRIEETKRILDELPKRSFAPTFQADSLEEAVGILAQRFKLVPFDEKHFGFGLDAARGGSKIKFGEFDYAGVPPPIEVRSDPEVVFLNKRRAVIDWLQRMLDAAEGRSTIYWRIEPEMQEIHISRDEITDVVGYRIYSRFSCA